MSKWQQLWAHKAQTALVLIFLASVITATYTASEALEERSASLAVTDMRIAVLSLLDIDQQSSRLGEAESEQVNEALETLARDYSTATHAVPLDERAIFDDEIATIVRHGEALRDGEMGSDMVHDVAGHRLLETTLRNASVAATAEAAAAERRAVVAAMVAATSLLALGASFIKGWAHRQRREVLLAAERDSAKRIESVLDNSLNSVLIVDSDGHFSYCSVRFKSVFGADLGSLEELFALFDVETSDSLAKQLRGELSPDEGVPLRSTLYDGHDRQREFLAQVEDRTGDTIIAGHLITFVEMTSVNEAKQRLVELASQDPLTGLPNRRALMDRLDLPNSSAHSLLMIDLDDFKGTNDCHGHDVGDELLCVVADRFAAVCPAGGLFRLGGDEFAVLVDGSSQPDLDQLGARLVESLEEPVELVSGYEEISASVGIAMQEPGAPSASLLRRADIALYAAKRGDSLQVVVLSDTLEQNSTAQRATSRALHEVSLADEMRIVYQPIIDSTTGEVEFMEALLRWTSPTLGVVPPDVFIPIAERSGQIVEVGRWVLEQAIAQFRLWSQSVPGLDFGLTVNVSPRQLMNDGFAESVLAILRSEDVAPSCLMIEVTESALVRPGDPEVEALVKLRQAGCRIACDDFGSGYSNLGQLMALPLDFIKVDRELLIHLSEMRKRAGSSDGPCAVMSAIAMIGKAMHAPIVAEGVETEIQARSLRESGVGYMQGYHFGRPVESGEVMDVIRGRSSTRVMLAR